jgi:hypothetical protein
MDVHPEFKIMLVARHLPQVYVYNDKANEGGARFYEEMDSKGDLSSGLEVEKKEKIVIDIKDMSWIPFDKRLSRLRFCYDRFNIVNFSISQEKLSKEITSMLIHLENPDLQLRNASLHSQEKDAKNKLFLLENNLINILSKENSDLLNDQELLAVLRKNKKESRRIEEFLKEARKLTKEMRINEDQMKPLSRKICVLFQIINKLQNFRVSYGQSIKELKNCLKDFIQEILSVRSISLNALLKKQVEHVSHNDEYYRCLYQMMDKTDDLSQQKIRHKLESSVEQVMIELFDKKNPLHNQINLKSIEITKQSKNAEISFRNNIPSSREFKNSQHKQKDISFMNFSTQRNNDSFSNVNNLSNIANHLSKLKHSEEIQVKEGAMHKNKESYEDHSNLDCSDIDQISEISFDENLEPDPLKLSQKNNVFKDKVQTVMTRKTFETEESRVMKNSHIDSLDLTSVQLKNMLNSKINKMRRDSNVDEKENGSDAGMRVIMRNHFFDVFRKKILDTVLSVVQSKDKDLVKAYLLFALKLNIEGNYFLFIFLFVC